MMVSSKTCTHVTMPTTVPYFPHTYNAYSNCVYITYHIPHAHKYMLTHSYHNEPVIIPVIPYTNKTKRYTDNTYNIPVTCFARLAISDMFCVLFTL